MHKNTAGKSAGLEHQHAFTVPAGCRHPPSRQPQRNVKRVKKQIKGGYMQWYLKTWNKCRKSKYTNKPKGVKCKGIVDISALALIYIMEYKSLPWEQLVFRRIIILLKVVFLLLHNICCIHVSRVGELSLQVEAVSLHI